jgi:hypothetical protein
MTHLVLLDTTLQHVRVLLVLNQVRVILLPVPFLQIRQTPRVRSSARPVVQTSVSESSVPIRI